MSELATELVPTEDDRLLQAEAAVRSYCGWHIAPSRTETKRFSHVWGRTIILPSLYVTAVTSVTADDTVLVEDVDFTWSESGILTLGTTFCGSWRRYQLVVVEFTHGYTTPPADVTAAVQARALRSQANPGGMLASQGAGPFSASFATTVPASEQSALDRYKLPSRP